MDIGAFCCLFVVYIYSAGYVELPIVLLYLLRCLVYHMLSKMGRNSRNLHRVIAYIYFDAWCITCCWGVSARSAGGGKIPYSSCIFNTAVVVACVIFTHGFSRCRGCWIWAFCCIFVTRIYVFGWLCQANCSVVSSSMLGVSHAVQNEKMLEKFV